MSSACFACIKLVARAFYQVGKEEIFDERNPLSRTQNRGMKLQVTIAAHLLAACAGLVHAQAETPAQSLAGPKVAPVVAPLTLIARDFNGKLVRPTISPEEAAVGLLTLNETEKTAVDTVLSERAAIFDRAIQENYELLLKLQGLAQMAPKEKIALLRQWNDALSELKRHGKLPELLAAGLTPFNAAAFRKLVSEYREAVIAEEMKVPEMSSEKPLARGQVVARAMLAELGGELKRSFDRRVAEGTAKLEEIASKVDATSEQKDKIQQLSIAYVTENKGKPTPQQRGELFRKVMEVLTPQQRQMLVKDYFKEKGK